MATFNDLVRVIAEVEGMDPMTVRGIGIKVREAGMITKSGRGLSAAKMTPQDAMALLIGVNGTAMAKDAADAVRSFCDLRLTVDVAMPPDPAERAEVLDESDPIDRTLAFGTPFHATLTAFISACIPQEDGATYFNHRFGSDVTVEITFHRPIQYASISVYWPSSSEDEEPEPFTAATFENPLTPRLSPYLADRSDSTTIGARTLMAVGQILAT